MQWLGTHDRWFGHGTARNPAASSRPLFKKLRLHHFDSALISDLEKDMVPSASPALMRLWARMYPGDFGHAV